MEIFVVNWCTVIVWSVAVALGAVHRIFDADAMLVFKKNPVVQRICRFAFLAAVALCLNARLSFVNPTLPVMNFVVDPVLTAALAFTLFWLTYWVVKALYWAWSDTQPNEKTDAED